MIDSPKYLPHLVDAFTRMGGIRYIFLTHRDDVADAEKYAQEFSSERIIPRLELSSQPGAEIVIEGTCTPRRVPREPCHNGENNHRSDDR